jgi:hypothetical protein
MAKRKSKNNKPVNLTTSQMMQWLEDIGLGEQDKDVEKTKQRDLYNMLFKPEEFISIDQFGESKIQISPTRYVELNRGWPN